MNKDALVKSLGGLLENTNDNIAVLSNSSAFIYEFLEDVNWVGFYLVKNGDLKLGPFQGRPACVDIKMGKGVCGSAAAKNETIIIENVRLIDNYISCHDETSSEIVVPIIVNNLLFGVLDIDSVTVGRFTKDDSEILNALVSVIESNLI